MKTAALALLVALLAPSVAAATPPTLLRHPITGERGMWLELELSRDALGALELRPNHEAQIQNLGVQLKLRGESLRDALEAQASAEESARRLGEELARESRERSETQLELLEARRARWTWGAVGAGGGAVLALILALTLR